MEFVFEIHAFSAAPPGNPDSKTAVPPPKKAEYVARRIQEETAPESWKEEQASIEVRENGLAVFNRRSVQIQIHAYLEKIGLIRPAHRFTNGMF